MSDTVKSEENILTNVKTFIEATKRKRTVGARITMNVVTASISGVAFWARKQHNLLFFFWKI
jgi:hypothetical protein